MARPLKVRVENMVSPSSGNEVANQFIIRVGKKTIFQSYDSIIAVKESGKPTRLDKFYWDYSTTTGKYRNQFLGEGIADTRKKIAEGVYKLSNLN
jgi:hypothetical protein